MKNEIFTIGHSTHSTDEFINLLKIHKITAIGDVRSSPYSKFSPQFNRENLKDEIKKQNIEYVYLGKELGPRSDDPRCYINKKASYDLISNTDLFKQGLKRLKDGLQKYKIALMCAEKDPTTCHRMILICRYLKTDNIKIFHILENGDLEANGDAEKRLMKSMKIPEATLFDDLNTLMNQAYDLQSEKIAYILNGNNKD